MPPIHSRQEEFLLQRAFSSVGLIRNLKDVQDALTFIPKFIPGDLLLEAAEATEILHEKHVPASVSAPGGLASLSPTELNVLLEQSTFAGSKALSFTQFLTLLVEVKRGYARRSTELASADSIRAAVDYVVNVLGDWNVDAEEEENEKGMTTLPHVAEVHCQPSMTASSSGGDVEMQRYLTWFGVHGEAELFSDDGIQGMMTDEDNPASQLPPLDGNDALEGDEFAFSRDHVTGRHSAPVEPKTRANSRAHAKKFEAIARVSVVSLHASKRQRVSLYSASEHATENQQQTLALGQTWLKGRGPRGGFFTHDVPPTTTEMKQHNARVVDASMRQSSQYRKHATHRERDERSLADLLRLPPLDTSDSRVISDRVDAEIHRAEASRHLSPQRRMFQSRPASSTSGSMNATNGNRSVIQQTYMLNRLIDETYRQAKDRGISTTNATLTVERKLQKQRERNEVARVQERRIEREMGFRI